MVVQVILNNKTWWFQYWRSDDQLVLTTTRSRAYVYQDIAKATETANEIGGTIVWNE